MKIFSFITKILLILIVFLCTYFYARYEKGKYFNSEKNLANELLLKELPSFNGMLISNPQKEINARELLIGSNGLFVHIWGTWCGPCEKEMPEFLKFAESTKKNGMKFLLIAVNDEELKINKFLRKLTIPANVTVALDKNNTAMDLFGTLKVPETFLFNKQGKHLFKFVGPKEWSLESLKNYEL